MEVMFSLKESSFDLQTDVHLERGDVGFSDGPDRAYLHYTYRYPDGREGEEVAAIWVLDAMAARVLACGLGAGDGQVCNTRPWRVTWIKNGAIAVKRATLGLDRAMWLVATLAPQDVLDRDTQLFGAHGVDVGDPELD